MLQMYASGRCGRNVRNVCSNSSVSFCINDCRVRPGLLLTSKGSFTPPLSRRQSRWCVVVSAGRLAKALCRLRSNMGRNKKSKLNKGVSTPKKLEDSGRGERLRKREDERAAKRAAKRRRLGKKPLAGKFAGHENTETKHTNKRRREVARLERLVSKLEEQLRDYRAPVKETPLDPELKRKRRRRDFYDLDTSHWKLTGAARPAASLPGAGGAELPSDRDPWVPGEDLFEKLGGGGKASASKARFYDGPEPCREYLDANHQLAQALHYDVKESKAQEARSRYERCLELDPADHVMAHRGLVRFLLDAGEADGARAVIDRFPDDRGCDMAWSLVAIEFVSWSVLHEEGSGMEVAEKALEEANKANPFLAWYVAYREIFEEVVEHADEIADPCPGSLEEAFWYMFREAGLWASLEGSAEWVADYLVRNNVLPPEPSSKVNSGDTGDDLQDGDSCDSPRGREGDDDDDKSTTEEDADPSSLEAAAMYAGMFETAVAMAAEAAEQCLLAADEGSGDEEGDEDEEKEEASADSGTEGLRDHKNAEANDNSDSEQDSDVDEDGEDDDEDDDGDDICE